MYNAHRYLIYENVFRRHTIPLMDSLAERRLEFRGWWDKIAPDAVRLRPLVDVPGNQSLSHPFSMLHDNQELAVARYRDIFGGFCGTDVAWPKAHQHGFAINRWYQHTVDMAPVPIGTPGGGYSSSVENEYTYLDSAWLNGIMRLRRDRR